MFRFGRGTGYERAMSEQLTIARVGHQGDGIAETPTGAVFVPGALPGEVVRAVVRDGRAEDIEIIEASADRAPIQSETYAECGVAPLQHWASAPYLAWKRDLKAGAGTAQGLKGIDAQARDLFRRPLSPHDLKGIEAIVFDPPRAGALEQTQQFAGTKSVSVVVGVSCNPTTFARDARVLIDAGFVLERVTPIDQFLWSTHVELVGVFRR